MKLFRIKYDDGHVTDWYQCKSFVISLLDTVPWWWKVKTGRLEEKDI